MEEKKRFNKTEYDNRYIKEHKDLINFLMEKGTKERIKAAADQAGQSSSEFIRDAIEDKLQQAGV